MPEVVRKRDGFRQVFVEAQSPRDGAANRRDLDGVGQSRPQMVASAVEENLGLVFETTKRARVNNPGAVALEFGADTLSASAGTGIAQADHSRRD